MKLPSRPRRLFAALCGLSCACLATGGAREAAAGMFRHSSLCAPTSTADCLPLYSSPCEETAGDASAPASDDHEDPPADPSATGGAGGGGPSGLSPTGKSVSFGNEGSFNANRLRGTSGSGWGGIGPGGGGGGGGGGSTPFFSGGSAPGSTSAADGGGSTPSIPTLGTSLSDPINPDPGTNFVFHYTVTPGGPGNASPLFFDPPLYSGYTFQILSGPNFASVDVPHPPAGTGVTQFTITFETFTETLTAGIPFDFTVFDPAGVSKFTITGDFAGNTTVQSRTIDTAITFVGGGSGSFSQTPIVEQLPSRGV